MIELNKCDPVSLEIWRNAYAVAMGALITSYILPVSPPARKNVQEAAADYADDAVIRYNNQMYPEKADG